MIGPPGSGKTMLASRLATILPDVALVGGGNYPRPGEVSLGHNGVPLLCSYRVGGGVVPAVLSHHRAYGSVPRRFLSLSAILVLNACHPLSAQLYLADSVRYFQL